MVLPALVTDVASLADTAAPLTGEVALASLPRVVDQLMAATGTVAVATRWQWDARRRPWLVGQLTTQVTLRCERCLEPLILPLDVAISLVLVRSDAEADRLDESLEPWLWQGPDFPVWDWVEEEILLALPLVPTHDAPCAVAGYLPPPTPMVEKPNPFAVLAKRKNSPPGG